MGDRRAKDRLYDGIAAMGKAVGSGRRLELLDLLAQSPHSVNQLADGIGQSVAATSAHLRTLAAVGLVTFRRQGNRVVYELTGPAVEDLLASLRHAAFEHADSLMRLQRDYLGDRSALRELSRADLLSAIERGEEIVILDVRPIAEFVAGHLPGARQVDLAALVEMASGLPPGVEVVAYCRGPLCVFADEAVRLLAQRGIPAFRLQDGFPEWRRAGLEVAVGAGSTPGTSGAPA